MLGIKQTDSILVTDLLDFSGSISDSIFNLKSVDLGVDMTGTVSGSGDEIEITGEITSDFPPIGSGIFRIVPTAAIHGELFAEGMVDGKEICIYAEDALGSGGEMDYRYEYTFPVTVEGFPGDLWLQTSSELAEGWYTVGDEPHYDDAISVRLGEMNAIEQENGGNQVYIASDDDIIGIVGTFDLEFGDGRTLFFAIPDTDPVPPSKTDLWTFSSFEVDGRDPEGDPNGVYLMLWFSVNGALTKGLYETGQWWLGIEWESPSGSLDFDVFPSDTETLEITYFNPNDRIEGDFSVLDGDLTGWFKVHFYEEWEP